MRLNTPTMYGQRVKGRVRYCYLDLLLILARHEESAELL